MLTFYGDDSGTHDRPDYEGPVVCGGYLATAENWRALEHAWDERIISSQPSIRYFKMRECFWLKREFEGWSREDADRKLNAVVDFIHTFAPYLYEVTSVLPWDEYRAVITEPVHDVFHHPYFLCMHGVMAEAGRAVVEGNSEEKISFVFDHQNNLEGDASVQFYASLAGCTSEVARRMGSISFADDRTLNPLQLADFIAWQTRRYHAKVLEDGGPRPEWTRMREHCPLNRCAKWRASGLANLIADIDERLETGDLTPVRPRTP